MNMTNEMALEIARRAQKITREEVVLDQPVTRRELLVALRAMANEPGARRAVRILEDKWGLV